MKKIKLIAALAAWVVAAGSLNAESSEKPGSDAKDAAYAKTLNDRAAKIIAALKLSDAGKSNSVHTALVQQYGSLSKIHQERDQAVAAAKAKAGTEKEAASVGVQAAKDSVKPKLDKLHGEFLATLGKDLSPEQVDQIKDGMTYGVLPLTYGVYLKMYPELTDEQKKQIKAWLMEARELAMDGGTSDEKHGIFGKYKGRINNYLSKAGYDAKKAEQKLKKPAAPVAPSQSK